MSCYHKEGDVLTMPIKLQVIKTLTRNDIIYYLVAPVDAPKRFVTLDGPFFVVNTEYDADDKLPDMDLKMLDQATEFIAANFQDEDPDGDPEVEGNGGDEPGENEPPEEGK